MDYAEKIQFLFQRFTFTTKNEEMMAGGPDVWGEVKSWREGEFVVVVKLSEFISVVNTGPHKATFRGYQIEPGAVFFSTSSDDVARIMGQDSNLGATPIHSMPLPIKPKPLERLGSRYIKLK